MVSVMMTDYSLLIFAALAVLIVIAVIKSAWKLVKLAVVIGVVYYVLTYFGLL